MQENSLNAEITDLIIRSLGKELNTEEEQILRNWLEEHPSHQEWYKQYVKSYFHFRWAQEEQIIVKERAGNKIFGALRRKRVVRWYQGMAASMILMITLSIVLLYQHEKVPESLPVVHSFIPQQTQPRLILSNGEVIGLDSTQKIITSKDGSIIYMNGNTGICYDSVSGQAVQEVEWHTVVVPRGGEYYIRLNDGSEVWLNSETEISYPVQFAGDIREISLKGEAYFKVTKEVARAFCVRSGSYQLKVYGTEFNLNTYDGENIEAVLVKGSVGFRANGTVGERRLKVNQLGIANSKTGGSQVQEVDVSSYIAWKNHDLIFVDENLESIMKKVARWYDVNIIFEDEASRNVRFNGNIPKYAELEKLLSLMGKTSDVAFSITDKTIRIFRKK